MSDTRHHLPIAAILAVLGAVVCVPVAGAHQAGSVAE
jgi:hypothetical protein